MFKSHKTSILTTIWRSSGVNSLTDGDFRAWCRWIMALKVKFMSVLSTTKYIYIWNRVMLVYSMEANTSNSYFELVKWFSQMMSRSAVVPRLPRACARKRICKFCACNFIVKYTHGEFTCPSLRLSKTFAVENIPAQKLLQLGKMFSHKIPASTKPFRTRTKCFYSRKTWFFFPPTTFQRKTNVCVFFSFFLPIHGQTPASDLFPMRSKN